MNEKNLIPFYKRTEAEQREIRSKGGKESARRRRDKRTFREIWLGNLSLPNLKKDGTPVLSPLTGKPMSVSETIAMRTLLDAMKGDKKALQIILGVLGEQVLRMDGEINCGLTAGITITHVVQGHTPAATEAEVIEREGIDYE